MCLLVEHLHPQPCCGETCMIYKPESWKIPFPHCMVFLPFPSFFFSHAFCTFLTSKFILTDLGKGTHPLKTCCPHTHTVLRLAKFRILHISTIFPFFLFGGFMVVIILIQHETGVSTQFDSWNLYHAFLPCKYYAGGTGSVVVVASFLCMACIKHCSSVRHYSFKAWQAGSGFLHFLACNYHVPIISKRITSGNSFSFSIHLILCGLSWEDMAWPQEKSREKHGSGS